MTKYSILWVEDDKILLVYLLTLNRSQFKAVPHGKPLYTLSQFTCTQTKYRSVFCVICLKSSQSVADIIEVDVNCILFNKLQKKTKFNEVSVKN